MAAPEPNGPPAAGAADQPQRSEPMDSATSRPEEVRRLIATLLSSTEAQRIAALDTFVALIEESARAPSTSGGARAPVELPPALLACLAPEQPRVQGDARTSTGGSDATTSQAGPAVTPPTTAGIAAPTNVGNAAPSIPGTDPGRRRCG